MTIVQALHWAGQQGWTNDIDNCHW